MLGQYGSVSTLQVKCTADQLEPSSTSYITSSQPARLAAARAGFPYSGCPTGHSRTSSLLSAFDSFGATTRQPFGSLLARSPMNESSVVLLAPAHRFPPLV